MKPNLPARVGEPQADTELVCLQDPPPLHDAWVPRTSQCATPLGIRSLPELCDSELPRYLPLVKINAILSARFSSVDVHKSREAAPERVCH